eukprot:gene240-251_t
MTTVLLFILLGIVISTVESFQSSSFVGQAKLTSKRSSQLNAGCTSLIINLLQRVDPSQARSEFFFFFFGGSGALGLGFKQIPGLIAEYQKVQALKGGVSKGGEDLQINPLATIGFPESLKADDLNDILQNFPSVETISANGPKRSYLAQRGLLEREGFVKSLPNKNPLAVYAVYEALAKGGGDLASPTEANQFITRWKAEGGLDAFKNDLTAATTRKYAAYSVFFFLIAVVLDLIVESGINAFL